MGGVDRRGETERNGTRLFCGLHGLTLVATYVAPAFFFGASSLRCSSALGLWPPRFCRASGWGACCLFLGGRGLDAPKPLSIELYDGLWDLMFVRRSNGAKRFSSWPPYFFALQFARLGSRARMGPCSKTHVTQPWPLTAQCRPQALLPGEGP